MDLNTKFSTHIVYSLCPHRNACTSSRNVSVIFVQFKSGICAQVLLKAGMCAQVLLKAGICAQVLLKLRICKFHENCLKNSNVAVCEWIGLYQ
jgi:hypothetical protein